MNRRKGLVDDVVTREWEMFICVPNPGGKVSCQESPKTFGIMRAAQLASWSDALLDSYLADLKDAALAGRNLLTEKYGHMMRSTAPDEYARIAHRLPAVAPRALDLIAQIVPIILAWEVALARMYPSLMAKGRPIFSPEDRPQVTSLETYLKGELATYSIGTLELYLAHVEQQRAEGINGSEITLACTTKQYGYASLQDANEHLARRAG
jgi:hypothetical protein